VATLCAEAHAAYPEIELADEVLAAAITHHAPEGHVEGYLEHCHAGDLMLAVAASRGDRTAIARLEREHAGVLDAMCGRFASTAHSRDDLRQILREHLLVGPEPALAEYSGQGRLESWLRITAVRTFLDLDRRKDRAREAPTRDGEIAMPDPDDLSLELIKSEYRAAVALAMRDAADRIDLADRHLLHQHYVAGISIHQLAAALGIHRTTAARRVVRARDTLVDETRALLVVRLHLPVEELDEVIGMVLSRLDLSLPRLLQGRGLDASR
jgi:RNA polymerase sigma-70 factor, ECF subfamily